MRKLLLALLVLPCLCLAAGCDDDGPYDVLGAQDSTSEQASPPAAER